MERIVEEEIVWMKEERLVYWEASREDIVGMAEERVVHGEDRREEIVWMVEERLLFSVVYKKLLEW